MIKKGEYMINFFKFFYIVFLVLTKISFSSDSINEIDSFSQIDFGKYTENDCFAFDLDDTVWVPTEKIMRNINFDERSKFLDEIRTISGNERVSYIYDTIPYQLVEEDLQGHIKNLNNNNIPTVAFTARRTGKATLDQKRMVEDDTIQIVQILGLKFNYRHFQTLELHNVNPNNPDFQEKIVDRRLKPFELSNNAMIKEGVIFTNNIDKGFVLGEIFNQGRFFPNRFILIDDKINNLKSVQEAIKNINERFNTSIAFEGFLYNGYLKLDNKIDPKIVEIQKQHFLQDQPSYISESKAKELLEK